MPSPEKRFSFFAIDNRSICQFQCSCATGGIRKKFDTSTEMVKFLPNQELHWLIKIRLNNSFISHALDPLDILLNPKFMTIK
jgi:hypothetical protein